MTFGLSIKNNTGNLYADTFNRSFVFNGRYRIGPFARYSGQYAYYQHTVWPNTLRNPIFFYNSTESSQSSYPRGSMIHAQQFIDASNRVNTVFATGSNIIPDTIYANVWVFETVANTAPTGYGLVARSGANTITYNSQATTPLSVDGWGVTVGSSNAQNTTTQITLPLSQGSVPNNWAVCIGPVAARTRQTPGSFVFTYALCPVLNQTVGSTLFNMGQQTGSVLSVPLSGSQTLNVAQGQYFMLTDTSRY